MEDPLLRPSNTGSSSFLGHFGILFVSVVFCVLSTLVFYIVDLSVVSLVYFIIILGITFYIVLIVYTKWREDISMSVTQGLFIVLLYNLLNFFYIGYLLERHTNLSTTVHVFGSSEYGIFVVWTIVAFVILPLMFLGYVMYINFTKTSSDEKTLQMITCLETQLEEVKKSQVENNTRAHRMSSELVQMDGQLLHPSSLFDTTIYYQQQQQSNLQTIEPIASHYPTLNMGQMEYQSVNQYIHLNTDNNNNNNNTGDDSK